MRLSIEWWNGHPIRFMKLGGNWPVVAQDVATALGYSDAEHLTRRIPDKYKLTPKLGVNSQGGKIILLTEPGIYRAVFGSKKPEADQFQDWVCQVIQQLRKQAGLQEYQAFRLLDKRVQNQIMDKLETDSDVDYIKANTVANKAISNKYGLPKMIKKGDMTPAMLKDRPAILSDVVELMNVKKRFGLDFSVSQTIYDSLDKSKGDDNHGASLSSK